MPGVIQVGTVGGRNKLAYWSVLVASRRRNKLASEEDSRRKSEKPRRRITFTSEEDSSRRTTSRRDSGVTGGKWLKPSSLAGNGTFESRRKSQGEVAADFETKCKF